MTRILTFFAKLLTSSVAEKLLEAGEARSKAQTAEAKLEAELEIARLKNQQASRELAGFAFIVVLLAWATPYILYDWKLLVWDKILGAGVTDPLSEELSSSRKRVMEFFFATAVGFRAIQLIKKH
jgi:hypothetical protein